MSLVKIFLIAHEKTSIRSQFHKGKKIHWWLCYVTKVEKANYKRMYYNYYKVVYVSNYAKETINYNYNNSNFRGCLLQLLKH